MDARLKAGATQVRQNMEEKFFGHAVQRKEGREKVTGRARYVDDLDFS